MPLPTGTRLGVHDVSVLVGSGGMGGVYRAGDTRLDRNVVLKVLPVGPSRHRFVLTPAGGVV